MRHTRPSIGQVCWTRLQAPGGLVELVAVQGTWVQVRHVLDHPAGYGQGVYGWYQVADLLPCAWPDDEAAPTGRASAARA